MPTSLHLLTASVIPDARHPEEINFFPSTLLNNSKDTFIVLACRGFGTDSFAVVVTAKPPHKLVPIVVGHVPIEISSFVYFSLGHGCFYDIKVLEEKPIRSPLTLERLEVKCNVIATLSNEEAVKIL